jgi:hypothetical protein
MRGFIELPSLEDGKPRLLAVADIRSVEGAKYSNRGTYVVTEGGGCFRTSLVYAEVKRLLEEEEGRDGKA